MFRPTPSLLKTATRRLQLTSKQGGKDYYKGTRSGAMGRHTKHGGYVIDWSKVRTYVAPDARAAGDADLTPFVNRGLEEPRPTFRRVGGRSPPLSGQAYLDAHERFLEQSQGRPEADSLYEGVVGSGT